MLDDITIRRMNQKDIDSVMSVEQQSFKAPWPRDIFEYELLHNYFAYYYVILKDQQIVGYAGMWLVLDDVQITNITILPEYRGQKLGETLFSYIIQDALMMGATHLSLEVRVSNVIAQNMYEKFGLLRGGIRRNYYSDNQEDALVMWVNLYDE